MQLETYFCRNISHPNGALLISVSEVVGHFISFSFFSSLLQFVLFVCVFNVFDKPMLFPSCRGPFLWPIFSRLPFRYFLRHTACCLLFLEHVQCPYHRILIDCITSTILLFLVILLFQNLLEVIANLFVSVNSYGNLSLKNSDFIFVWFCSH